MEKSNNTSIFTLDREDYTLGNVTSQRLLKYNSVEIAAYQVEHPHVRRCELGVTTNGVECPRDAVVECCKV
jgi:DNA-directed RNA polymerase subunit L